MVFYGRTRDPVFLDYLFHDDARVIGTFFFLLPFGKQWDECNLSAGSVFSWSLTTSNHECDEFIMENEASRNHHRLACNMDKLALI